MSNSPPVIACDLSALSEKERERREALAQTLVTRAAAVRRLKPLERPAFGAFQLSHGIPIQQKNDAFLAAREHERRIGDQRHPAGAHIQIVTE